MIVIENRFIPVKGYKCMTVWPFIFLHKGRMMNDVDRQHEGIHGAQQKEMLPVAFAVAIVLASFGCGWWSLMALPLWFYWYVLEWIVRFIAYGNQWEAYRNISFEQEAFIHERDFGTDYYLPKRRPFAWTEYVAKKSFDKTEIY